jgi:predicted phosphodiesterase
MTLAWLHLSDWHQKSGDLTHDRRLMLERLLDDVSNRQRIYEKLSKIDCVFFTGDIAYEGADAEFTMAQELLIDPLKLLLGEKTKFFFCPGNHDIDRKKVKAICPTISRTIWDAARNGPGELSDKFHSETAIAEFKKPLSGYYAFCKTNGQNYSTDRMFFHRSFEMNNSKVGVVALDTAWACGQHMATKALFDETPRVSDYGRLLLTEKQVLDAASTVSQCDLKIALMHHPYYWLSEADQATCEQTLFHQFDLVLHGHEHRPRINRLQSTFGEVALVPAGSSFGSRFMPDTRYNNSYNFGCFNFDQKAGMLFQRVWSNDHTRWIPDERHLYKGTARFEMPDKRRPLTPAMLNVLNEAKQRLLPFAEKKVATLIAVDRTFAPEVIEGNEYLKCTLETRMTLPTGGEPEQLTVGTTRNARLTGISSPNVKALLFNVRHLKLNGHMQDVTPLLSGERVTFPVAGDITDFSYSYSSLETPDGVWIYRLNKFSERLQITIRKTSRYAFEYSFLGGLEHRKRSDEIRGEDQDRFEWNGLLMPGEGVLVQWYLK